MLYPVLRRQVRNDGGGPKPLTDKYQFMEWQILHQMPCALRLMGHKQYVSTALLGFDVAVLAQLGGPFGNLRRALFLKPGPTMQKQMIHKYLAVRLMKASTRSEERRVGKEWRSRGA